MAGLNALKGGVPNRPTLGLPVSGDVGEVVWGMYNRGFELRRFRGVRGGDVLVLDVPSVDVSVANFWFRVLGIFGLEGRVYFVCYSIGVRVVTVLEVGDLNLLKVVKDV